MQHGAPQRDAVACRVEHAGALCSRYQQHLQLLIANANPGRRKHMRYRATLEHSINRLLQRIHQDRISNEEYSLVHVSIISCGRPRWWDCRMLHAGRWVVLVLAHVHARVRHGSPDVYICHMVRAATCIHAHPVPAA